MLKTILLATAMIATPPILAQGQAIPAAPVQGAPTTQTPPAAAPTGDALAAQTAPAAAPTSPPTDPVTTTEALPQQQAQATAAPASQVAQIVDQEFVGYDKDADGKLSREEFGTWMVALKTASDPATKADSPETKKWLGAAFVQADKDKSASLTKDELTGFLSQGQG